MGAGRRDAATRGGGGAARPRPGRDGGGRRLAGQRSGTRWRVRDDVQPMAVVARADGGRRAASPAPEFQAALARRGVTDPDQIQVDAGRRDTSARPRSRSGGWPAASRSCKPPRGRQRVGAPGRRRDRAGRPEHAARCCGSRTTGVVPIPPRAASSTPRAGGPLRGDIAAARDHPARGRRASPSTATGRPLAGWQLRVGFNAREGLVLHHVGYEDGGRVRPILHRASLVRDGGALRRPQPDPLLPERLRRRRERRRRAPPTPLDARLRLPRRDPLLRRRVVDDAAGEPVHDPERDLHARGGRRRALEAQRLARRPRPRCGARAGS